MKRKIKVKCFTNRNLNKVIPKMVLINLNIPLSFYQTKKIPSRCVGGCRNMQRVEQDQERGVEDFKKKNLRFIVIATFSRKVQT